MCLRADRADNDGVGKAPVERAPRAPAGTGSNLPKLDRCPDPAAVREGELVAIDLQFLESGLHRVALAGRETLQFTLRLRVHLDFHRLTITELA